MKKLTYNLPLDIAVAKSAHAVKWKNTKTDWQAVALSLSETEVTAETQAAYFKMPKDKQDEIKDVGGFVGGKLKGGIARNRRTQTDIEVKAPYGLRRKGHVEYRQMVALDVDFGTLDVWLDFRELGFAGLFYTTHKHKPTDPRLRVVFPLDRPVSPDEYEAIARVVASWLGIDLFDDTTYQPTRLMYYPSTSKGAEYLFDVYDAPIASADEILASLEDWEDPSSWPVSSRQQEVKRHNGTSVEDPTTKAGVIGAFCRAFTIDEAIDEFLADVYEPTDEPDRYSYALGSTSKGLHTYDNLTAYSHHATDPASQKLCNAFDLVRLHKFGELDERAKPDTETSKLPSYKAMADFAGNLAPVKKELLAARRAKPDDYDQLEARADSVAYNDDWVEDLEMTGKNKDQIKNTINNVVLILNNDENLRGRFAYNEFDARETAFIALPWDKKGLKYPRPLTDADDAQLLLYMENAYGITRAGVISVGLKVATSGNSYHPVKDYLDACEWDGTERLDTLFIDLFGADDNPYIRAITRKSFTAAVARIYNEGCKFDYVVVILGEQGKQKTTTIELMGGQWFSNSLLTMEGVKGMESLQGAWLIELGELAGMRKAQVDEVKHFVTKRVDIFRVAYGKRNEHFPRRCVFFATSNVNTPLRDTTGNRRFWMVNTFGASGSIAPKDYLTPVMVSQLWAEAKQRFNDGELLYLPHELEEVAHEIQADHLEQDERGGVVEEYLKRLLPTDWAKMDLQTRRMWLEDDTNVGTVRRERVCVMEVWAECFANEPKYLKRMDSFEISNSLRALKGWSAETKLIKTKLYGPQRHFINEAIAAEETAKKYKR